jgi:hypothetical protein
VSNQKIPAIPEPTLDIRSIQNTTLALKEAVETISGQRGTPIYPTWDDLVRLGIVSQSDAPR